MNYITPTCQALLKGNHSFYWWSHGYMQIYWPNGASVSCLRISPWEAVAIKCE